MEFNTIPTSIAKTNFASLFAPPVVTHLPQAAPKSNIPTKTAINNQLSLLFQHNLRTLYFQIILTG